MAGRDGLKEDDVSGHEAPGLTGQEALGLPVARHAELDESCVDGHGTLGFMGSEATKLISHSYVNGHMYLY